jgi:glyoxylase-like metal-dependent hydrolase (beta-lactamase superfamily II)
MIFSLDVRRARKGDCLVLHYGSKTNPGLGLIDGGPSQVYGPHLKPRLEEIRKLRKLGPDDALPVDFMMVSHIDDDHINGILELTKELLEAKAAKKPLPLKIKSVWHNTFDDIIGNSPKELTAAVTAQFGAASLSGEPDTDGLDPDVAKVLASVGQGFRLRDDIRGLKLRINPEFAGQLVIAKKKGKTIDMGKGLKFTVIGPMHDEIAALQKDHDTFLKKKEKAGGTASLLAAFTDSSVANLSSLVVLAEVGKKRILLTGDARGDKVLEGLELVGLLKKDGKSTMHVDVFKGPHHGSDRNADPILFRRVTADHYVFSGNGEHGNPERETLQMLLDERGDEDDFTIHLTYPIHEIDVGRKADWEKEQAKEKAKKKKNPKAKVRANWSAKKNSLASFFAAHKKFAAKVVIVPEDEPHVINLLDDV